MTQEKSEKFSPPDISDEDIFEAMKEIAGYLDITPGDFKELYLKAYRHAVLRLTGSVRAADIMTREVVSVTKETPLAEVARIMAERKISGVPVLESDGEAIGVISEKDFLFFMGAKRSSAFTEVVAGCLRGSDCLVENLHDKRAVDIMTSPAVTIGEESTATEIVDLFSRKGINRAPVLDASNKMVGIVSRLDVMKAFTAGKA